MSPTDGITRIVPRRLLPVLTLILALRPVCVPASEAAARFYFDIPAGRLSEELLLFAKTTRIQPLLVTAAAELDGVWGREVRGNLEASEALRRILEGSRWTYQFDSPNTVSIVSLEETKTLEQHSQVGVESWPSGSSSGSARDPTAVEQVVVTGTLIRGLDAITAPLVILGGNQITRAGYGTVQGAIDALPIASNNTAREDFPGLTGNYNNGTGVNLRGLGTGATLVLVNGRRQPLSGSEGSFVDVSTIPITAIDKIEVMPDGASALYGSDAIAGVVNIVLRQDLDGRAETNARAASLAGGGDELLVSQLLGQHWNGGKVLFLYQFSDRKSLPISARPFAANADRRSRGGDDFRSVNANPGNILDPQTLAPAFAIPAGQDGTALSADDLLPDQVNRANQFSGSDLLPERRTHSAYFTLSQSLSSTLEFFAEGRFNLREARQNHLNMGQLLVVPASNPFFVDPFGSSPFVLVGYDVRDDFGQFYGVGQTRTAAGALGLKADFGGGWQSTLSVSDAKENMHWVGYNMVDPAALAAALGDPNPATAFNPFGAGSHTNPATLAAVRTELATNPWSQIVGVNLVADGPIAETSFGVIKLALGADLRQERLQQRAAFAQNVSRHSYERSIVSGFGELALPLGIGLELSVAGRWERYSDLGATTNPKIGIRWAPSPSIRFRGGWGTSFRAPKMVDLDVTTRANSAGFGSVPDPKSPSGQSLVLGLEGNSADLHQETATTWTAGLDVSPVALPGLRVSATYFSIDYRGQVARPGPLYPWAILQQESTWGAVITRNPTAAAVAAVCNSPVFDGSVADCLVSSPAAIVDFRLRNLARTTENGVDIDIQHGFESRFSYFRFGLEGT